MKLSKTLQSIHLKSIRLVEMLAWRKISELLEMLRTQRRCEVVFLREPFPQVHQSATIRTERTVIAGKPFARLPACRTLHLKFCSHESPESAPQFVANGLEVFDGNRGGLSFDAGNDQRGLSVCKDRRILFRGKRLAVHHRLDVL